MSKGGKERRLREKENVMVMFLTFLRVGKGPSLPSTLLPLSILPSQFVFSLHPFLLLLHHRPPCPPTSLLHHITPKSTLTYALKLQYIWKLWHNLHIKLMMEPRQPSERGELSLSLSLSLTLYMHGSANSGGGCSVRGGAGVSASVSASDLSEDQIGEEL